jgi:hypothetical protein
MWLSERCRQLDSFETDALTDVVLGLPEHLWRADEALTQELTLNRQTHSIYLKSISATEFARIIASRPLSPEDVGQQAGWESLHSALQPFIDAALAHFPPGGIVTRIQLARMQPGAEIKPHVDHSSMLIASHRLHIPLTTSGDVIFKIDGKPATMTVGNLYELNNRVRHSVVNSGTADRIHLIVDYLPPAHNLPTAFAPGFEQRRKQRLINAIDPPPAPRSDFPLPKVIATSVVRGANKDESHGGIYLVDLALDEVEQVVDWNTVEISWEGRGWDRGLRGIAVCGQQVFVAASDELFRFDRQFKINGSWRSPFLRHAHEISRFDDHLLVTSTGFDSILRFNLTSLEFDRGWLIRPRGKETLNLSTFDPRRNGPPPGNSIHLNNVFQDASGMYVSGRGLPFLLQINDGALQPLTRLPMGTHNVFTYADGVLFNDTSADLLAYEAPGQFCYLDVPRYRFDQLENADLGDDKLARQGFGRGLCPYRDNIVIAGSSPSTITAWDLTARSAIKSVNISMDIRNAVHGLEIWP